MYHSHNFSFFPFTLQAPENAVESTRRTFVKFVLEPLYKIYSIVLSAEVDNISELIR